MPKKDNCPRYLMQVLEAVGNPKQSRGFTVKSIINRIKTVRTSPRLNFDNRSLVLQVRKALRYGLDRGLLRHAAGRYKLISKSKGEQNGGLLMNSDHSNVVMCRHQRRRSGGRRRRKRSSHGHRRRKRHSGHRRRRRRTSCYSCCSDMGNQESSPTTSLTSLSSDAEVDGRSRRRRNSHRRRRRKRRRKSKSKSKSKSRSRSSSLEHSDNDEEPDTKQPKKPTPKNEDPPSEEANRDALAMPSTSNMRRRRGRNRNSIDRRKRVGSGALHKQLNNENVDRREPNYDAEMPPDCGNSECICNFKQEPHDPTPEDNDRSNYIN